MEIISHRGFWTNKDERNTSVAFLRSFNLGIGTETDLRDHNGEIVVEHDLPKGSPLTFTELLHIMDGRNLTLALNIKADGLGIKIKEILGQFNHTNYFTFDMSVPELVRQIKQNLNVFTGISDIQPYAILTEHCSGIWLDCFNSDWYSAELIDNLLDNGKRVCLVSADLHSRPTDTQWNMLKSIKGFHSPELILCTDYPLEAQAYFAGEREWPLKQ